MKAAFLVNSKNRLTNIGNNQKVEIFDIQNGLIVPLKTVFFSDYDNLFEILILNKCNILVVNSIDIDIYKKLQNYKIEVKHYGNITLNSALLIIKENTIYNPIKEEQQFVQDYELGADFSFVDYFDDDDIGGS